MASGSFRNIFEPQSGRLDHNSNTGGTALIKDAFGLRTLLLMGALFQTIISLIVPARYAFVPMAIFLLHSLATTIVEIRSPTAWSKGSGANTIPYKFSAQIPNETYKPSSAGEKPIFGSTGADKGIVVLHLGIRFNHPLGILGPCAKEMGEVSKACNDRVMAHIDSSDDDFGCLGMSRWQSTDERESRNTLMTVYYFRDMDGLNRFAHDSVHRKAWDYYMKEFGTENGRRDIGVFHEAYYAPPGMWETVYMNMQPTLLGRAMAPVKNESTGKTEWVRTLVDARHKGLRSQWARMGRFVGDRYPADGYGHQKGEGRC
ncbi:protein of unknown function (DUF4188) domain containing protein [Naviculisporaceae sp. PSN 640]